LMTSVHLIYKNYNRFSISLHSTLFLFIRSITSSNLLFYSRSRYVSFLLDLESATFTTYFFKILLVLLYILLFNSTSNRRTDSEEFTSCLWLSSNSIWMFDILYKDKPSTLNIKSTNYITVITRKTNT
jgi:hypothetical protein